MQTYTFNISSNLRTYIVVINKNETLGFLYHSLLNMLDLNNDNMHVVYNNKHIGYNEYIFNNIIKDTDIQNNSILNIFTDNTREYNIIFPIKYQYILWKNTRNTGNTGNSGNTGNNLNEQNITENTNIIEDDDIIEEDVAEYNEDPEPEYDINILSYIFYNMRYLYNNGDDSNTLLSFDEIYSLRKIQYKDINSICSSNIYTKCPMSQEDFDENTIITLLPCSHYFSSDYINYWLAVKSDKCPLCSKRVN